jgi:hypothetical protein
MTEGQWRSLQAGLRALGEETQERSAPPKLEAALRAALRARRRERLLPWWRMAAAVVIAVSLGAGVRVVLLNRHRDVVSERNEVALPPPLPPPPVETRVAETQSAPQIERTVTAARRAPANRVRGAVEQQDNTQGILTPWFVNTALPDVEYGELTRVRVSSHLAAAFGSRSTSAEVFVGEDGLARAIRFVR